MSNIETVKAIYGAFGRGDIDLILGHLAEEVEWEYGVNSTDVPWLQPGRGRSAAASFFQCLGALDFSHFEVTRVIGEGDIVLGLCSVGATVRATGRQFSETDEVHIWHFGADGKVTRFRHRADTHQHWLAYHGG